MIYDKTTTIILFVWKSPELVYLYFWEKICVLLSFVYVLFLHILGTSLNPVLKYSMLDDVHGFIADL